MSRIEAMRSILRTAPLVAVTAVSLAAGNASPSFAQNVQVASTDGLREVGKLDRIPNDVREIFGDRIVPAGYDADPTGSLRGSDQRNATSGTAVIAPTLRQIWQPYHITDAGITKTALVVRDLDNQRILKTWLFDEGFSRATPSGAGEWMHAIDEKNGRLFFASDFGMFEISGKTFAVHRFSRGLPQERKGGTTFPSLAGLTYDPYGDRLIGAYGFPSNTSALNTNSYIYLIDPKTETITGPRILRSCTGPFPPLNGAATNAVSVLIPNPDYVYIPCHRSGNSGAVVRISRPRLMEQQETEDVVVGPVSIETALADHGGGRLVLVTLKGEMWVFDAKTMAFVGVVASTTEGGASPPIGYGVDHTSGRLFFQSPAFGVGIADGRYFPIPQARTAPSRRGPGQERIWADPKTNRIFVLGGTGGTKDSAYKIYDIGTAPVPPPPPDPDRSTVDADEKPGVTQSRYNATGSGYGARVLLANGISTVPPAPAVGLVSPTAEAIAKYVNSRCGYTDRELSAGRVFKAEYDTGSTSAQAMAAQVDDRTQQDLARLSRCDLTLRDGKSEVFSGIFATAPPLQAHDTGPGWNHLPAECTSSEGGEEKTGMGIDKDPALGTSKVTCPLPSGRLVADAESRLDGGVKVGKAWSHVEIVRTAKGVTSTVVSEARDIDIAGQIQLAEVRSTAESTANGRPHKDPLSKHSVTIKGVTIAGTSVCGASCPLPTVIQALNQAAAGRAQFRVASGLDDGLLYGSPKGSLTAVQKSSARQNSDLALVGDFTTDVPGLEMIVYNDNVNWGRARQLYQFAGVATVANYNITIQPTGIGFPDSGDPTDPSNPATIGGLGGDGMSDLSAGGGAPGGNGQGALGYETAGNEGGLGGLFRALARGIRLFWSNPRQALLLLTAWSLLLLPATLSRRRRLLAAARSV